MLGEILFHKELRLLLKSQVTVLLGPRPGTCHHLIEGFLGVRRCAEGLPLAWIRVRRLRCSICSGDCPGHGDLMVNKTLPSGIPQNVSILEGMCLDYIVTGSYFAHLVWTSPLSSERGKLSL